jgi:hypothetical protein
MKTFVFQLSWPKLALFVLPILLCGDARAQLQPTLSLDFENGVQATARDGKTIAPRVEGKAEIADGKFGKAFKSGPSTGYLHFPTEGIVSMRSGTVEMWVMPIDWTGEERAFHSFFDARGPGGSIFLYKYFTNSNLLMLTAPAPGGPYHSASANVADWKPGEWHHIAGTWSPRSQEVYVDGKLIDSNVPNLPTKLDPEFRLGDHPWNEAGISRTSSSLIDNIRIYDRALSPQHIAAHFAGDYNKTFAPSLESGKLDYSVDPQTRAITAYLGITQADMDMSQLRADFSLTHNNQTIEQSTGRPFDETLVSQATFKPLQTVGAHQLNAVLRDASGKEYGRRSITLMVPDTAQWMNNSIGEKAGVLPPWTPLQVKKNAGGNFSVVCWGREYQFGNSAWPLQIVSQNQPLLQSPVALKVLAGGREIAWQNASAKIVFQSPEAVEIEGRATAAAGVLLTTNLRLEYDGLMVVTMKLSAPPNWKPDAVTLDIPVRETSALYRHRWSSGKLNQQKIFAGALPQGAGVVDKSAFLPAAWLGDNERGLFWFCESAQFWPSWKDENAFQTVRENGAATMRFNLLKGQDLPQDWSYQFGLQATPVKPIPRDWRKWRLGPAPRANLTVPWPYDQPDSMEYFGYAAAKNPEIFQKRIDDLHAKGMKVLPYSLLNGSDPATPDWKYFYKRWQVHHLDPPAELVSPTQEDWRDFVIWKNQQFLKRYNLDGFYHDLTYPYGWNEPAANTGWFDGKEWQNTYPMLAFRELYRRNYAMVKADNPNNFLIGHIGMRLAIPVVAYEDAYLDGESLLGRLKDSYMDVMPLDEWRTRFWGRQWGVIPIVLPEFRGEAARDIQPTRGLAALVMLHDSSVWPIWSNGAAWKEMFDALDSFGYVDSDFIPYFDPTPPASTDMKDVYISVYKRSDGRALAIVGNTSREDRSGTVTLNAKRIGLPVAGVLSWPDKTPVQQDGEKITLDVPRLGYRMLLIGKAP